MNRIEALKHYDFELDNVPKEIIKLINEAVDENIKLKQALNEIRKYCKKINYLYWVEDDEPIYVSEYISQIIDKVGGNEE